jgi:hypothetical protein
MPNFNGGTVSLSTSFSPLGAYAGYLLMQAGNLWLAIAFLALTSICFCITLATLVRYTINFYRLHCHKQTT